MMAWHTLRQQRHLSRPHFRTWHQPTGGDTRKRSPSLRPLPLAVTVEAASSKQLKAFVLQTSVEMCWWEHKAAQDSHKSNAFCRAQKRFLSDGCHYKYSNQTFGPTFWWHKFIKYHLRRNLNPLFTLFSWLDYVLLLDLVPGLTKH